MAKKRFTTEQIITKLREAEVPLSQGKTAVQVCQQMEITERTCCLLRPKTASWPTGLLGFIPVVWSPP